MIDPFFGSCPTSTADHGALRIGPAETVGATIRPLPAWRSGEAIPDAHHTPARNQADVHLPPGDVVADGHHRVRDDPRRPGQRPLCDPLHAPGRGSFTRSVVVN